MENIWTSFWDFLIPRFCPACKKRLPPSSHFVCAKCLQNIKIPGHERILFEYNRNFAGTGIISDFTSQYLFEKDKEIQFLIHSLKYEKRFLLGVFLGKMLGETIKKSFPDYKIDAVIPVPLHHLKKTEREFNQSYYIAKGVHQVTGLKINNHLLKRSRYTESQTGMNQSEREENIKEAFSVKKSLTGKNFLIVDDVITTGATIRECGKVLLNAGAEKIYAASVAIAD